ncbi:hypothetical protein B0A48_10190 [Cryoendolithus antarcticus]|uniref:Uncharacterized protein n=1 Tax=Cryoendolithus antarcticus TaxID=1507870 RepID=A0A1V8SWJ7_9PEZI|nr:hypothetical protein B0A48_10190 [Cryoendolithus antarcticus]
MHPEAQEPLHPTPVLVLSEDQIWSCSCADKGCPAPVSLTSGLGGGSAQRSIISCLLRIAGRPGRQIAISLPSRKAAGERKTMHLEAPEPLHPTPVLVLSEDRWPIPPLCNTKTFDYIIGSRQESLEFGKKAPLARTGIQSTPEVEPEVHTASV